MGFIDKVKGGAADIARRNQETHIKLHVTSGKKIFFSSIFDGFDSAVVLRVNENGFIYFDEIEGLYKVSDFEWGGAMYESISRTAGQVFSQNQSTTKGKSKRTGRVLGAAVGGAIAGPAGLAVGAMLGTGNKKTFETQKGGGRTRSESTTISSQREVSSPAYMTLVDQTANVSFSFGFDCDSKIYGELRNIFLRSWKDD